MKRTSVSLIATLIYTVSSFSLQAQSVVTLDTIAKKYQPVQVTNEPEFHFPNSARRTRQESFIRVRYDVDKTGQPHNFHMVRGTGTDVFNKLLNIHLSGWQVTPATHNGEPIAQKNLNYTFTYYLNRRMKKDVELPMRVPFHEIYLKMVKHLKHKEYDEFIELKELLMQANIVNFNETRRLWVLINSFYNRTDASIHDKIYSLQRASQIVPRSPQTTKMQTKILANLFKEQLNAGQTAAAVMTFYRLSGIEEAQAELIELGSLYDKAQSTFASRELLKAEYRVEEIEMLEHMLYRNYFKVSTTEPISYSQLICDSINAEFKIETGKTYQFPIEWGNCQLQLQSEQGSIINITEFTEQSAI